MSHLKSVVMPNRYDARVVAAIERRLELTSQCTNATWHNSAPVRAIELCAECIRVSRPSDLADLW